MKRMHVHVAVPDLKQSIGLAAVIALTKSLGKELVDTAIRVNCVTPAAVRIFLWRRPRAACLALGCRLERGDAAYHINVRHHEIRTHARPRRGTAPGHAGLHRRYVRSSQCLSCVLGAVRRGGRRCSQVRTRLGPGGVEGGPPSARRVDVQQLAGRRFGG